MTTQIITDGVTLSAASWGNDIDTASYCGLTTVAGTNTITAVGPTSMTAYAARLKFLLIPAATNTGATTINLTCNSVALGARNIFANGAACIGGELVIGVPTWIVDDGTRFHIAGFPNIPAFTADASPDRAADFLLSYDTSAAGLKKVLMSKITAFKVGTFTYDSSTASGTQAITGVGFAPRAVVFLQGTNGASNVSVGIDDGTTAFGIGDDNVDSATNWIVSTTQSLIGARTIGGSAQGHITTLGTDGFTITWTKTGSPTGTLAIGYLALG